MKAESPASPFRLVIGDILILLALLLTADVLIVMPKKIHAVVLKADYQEIFRYELIICAVLLLFALDVRFNLFTRSGLVLGLALEDGKPTDDLVSRLNTAQAYLQEYPEARLILTGGNADGSGRTEADVMHDILLERGVTEDRMILEDRSNSTKENFRNTAQMIDPRKPVVLISSDYHMDRAVRTAESAGFSDVLRLPKVRTPCRSRSARMIARQALCLCAAPYAEGRPRPSVGRKRQSSHTRSYSLSFFSPQRGSNTIASCGVRRSSAVKCRGALTPGTVTRQGWPLSAVRVRASREYAARPAYSRG